MPGPGKAYLLVPLDEPEPVLPLELPELPEEPLPELPEPMLLLGELVLLPLEPLLPLAPLEPDEEPDWPKCASHSLRETWPSLLVSTDEKLGAELELDDAPDAAGDEEEDEDEGLLELPDELCASATLDRANSAAAVAALTTFRFNIGESPWMG